MKNWKKSAKVYYILLFDISFLVMCYWDFTPTVTLMYMNLTVYTDEYELSDL
jgi:hypothetical protein